jgi:uncharacterized membrane protein
MKYISKTIFTGVVTVIPLVVTVYFLFWLGKTTESALGVMIRWVLPENVYMPGMGIVTGLLIAILVGVMMRIWFFQKLIEWGESLLIRIPLIKSIYGSLKDFMHFLSKKGKDKGSRQVVMVSLGDTGMEIMGLVTRQDFSDLVPGIGSKNHVAVYIPMSYQIGGHTLIAPTSSVRPVDLPMEKAMRFALTAGMTTADPQSQA